MQIERFQAITSRYAELSVAVIGDFCLDRYFEIDPNRPEISIETGLPVHNVTRTRCQPGAAGTILNNLLALGVRKVFPIGICGEDGEGYDLRKALAKDAAVDLQGFKTSPERHTFTYSKPLVMHAGRPPEELNRLDLKNWTATPEPLRQSIAEAVRTVTPKAQAAILLDQVDISGTGVITPPVLASADEVQKAHPQMPILADSRRGLGSFPSLTFKINKTELAATIGSKEIPGEQQIAEAAIQMARRNGRPVFVTLDVRGILGASPDGTYHHIPALPLRGPIDVVGAGDSVTANLTMALAAGATVQEAVELAILASSLVIHQLGTTGAATVAQIAELGKAAGLIR